MLDRLIVLRLTVMLLLAGTAAVGGTIKLPEEANGFGTVKVVVGADYSWTKGKKTCLRQTPLRWTNYFSMSIVRETRSLFSENNSLGAGKSRGLLVVGLKDGIGLSGTVPPAWDLAPSTTDVPEPGGTLVVLRGYYSERRRRMPRQTAGYCAIRPNSLD
ncbi:MAG: hypothetical protein JWN34_5849 [Bryobacterales bacterium]|nr:hypothetical protein [Bryobacterales bacterium]